MASVNFLSLGLVLEHFDKSFFVVSKIELYFNTTNKGAKETVNDVIALKNHDTDLYNFVRELFFCENSYINKCKSNKGMLSQRLFGEFQT
jgi:hypothetical protein